MQQEGLSVPKVARKCMIPRSDGYVLLKEFNLDNWDVLPGKSMKKKSQQRNTSKVFAPAYRISYEVFR